MIDLFTLFLFIIFIGLILGAIISLILMFGLIVAAMIELARGR